MPGKAGLVEMESGTDWEWDSRTSPSRGSRGKLQMEEEEFERRWKCKRQLEGHTTSRGGKVWFLIQELNTSPSFLI